MSLLVLDDIQSASELRNQYWDPDKVLGGAFFATELAGEVGEACNVVKKLERERLGLRGSRDTVAHLSEELADVIICACLLANHYHIGLDLAVRQKFNDTSRKLDLPVLI